MGGSLTCGKLDTNKVLMSSQNAGITQRNGVLHGLMQRLNSKIGDTLLFITLSNKWVGI
jgi:hypothetical protein